MARAVVEHGAHLGLALDGDADRLIVVDEKGHIVDGDAIMAVCTGRAGGPASASGPGRW